MKLDFHEATNAGYLKPADSLKVISGKKEDEFRKGFIFEKEPEVLTRGHIASKQVSVSHNRISKLQERAIFSNYGLLLPTRRRFPSMVRITAYVITFVSKYRLKANLRHAKTVIWTGPLLCESSLRFSAFPIYYSEKDETTPWISFTVSDTPYSDITLIEALSTDLKPVPLAFFLETHSNLVSNGLTAVPSSKFLNMALRFYFRKACNEVIQFNSKSVVEKKAVLQDGILLSRGRIIQGMNFIETAELDNLNLGQLGIKTKIPVIDRFSPLAYSIGQHIHWIVAQHKGIESCLRISLQHVNILQGMNLFREIGEECIRCNIKRGKFVQATMGPLSDKQLIIAPPFYATQIDLCGPFRVFVPGFERETRASKVKETKAWIMVAVCSGVNILQKE